MAILRSQDGKYYEVEDSALSGKEVPADKLPSYPPPTGGIGPGSSGAIAGGLVQIFVSPPQNAGQGPDLGPPPGQTEGADVQGHSFDVEGRRRWFNCWHNCWNNWHNCWHNCWHNYWCPW